MKQFFLAAIAFCSLMAWTTKSSEKSEITVFTIELKGENEATEDGGDPDGTGMARLIIDQKRNTITYLLKVNGIETPTSAHIHEAPEGSAGPVVAPLKAPVNGTSAGRITLSSTEILEILENPEDYYVNVHNAIYPGGALRGQLQ